MGDCYNDVDRELAVYKSPMLRTHEIVRELNQHNHGYEAMHVRALVDAGFTDKQVLTLMRLFAK